MGADFQKNWYVSIYSVYKHIHAYVIIWLKAQTKIINLFLRVLQIFSSFHCMSSLLVNIYIYRCVWVCVGLRRGGKSCRLRWLNYLKPDIKRGNISSDEEDLIIRLHSLLGNRYIYLYHRYICREFSHFLRHKNTRKHC